ncbi:MAG: hypothetical protein ABFS35_05975 [Bacteroidota bacterium]
MIKITKKHLIIFSALVWYAGSISLLIKSVSLLNSAHSIYPNLVILLLVFVTGLTIGFFKGKYIFVKSCKKNIRRINELEKVKPWLFFKPSFMIALVLMITTGTTLSHFAEGDYAAMLAVAILDLTISMALFYSSFVYWQKKLVLQQ